MKKTICILSILFTICQFSFAEEDDKVDKFQFNFFKEPVSFSSEITIKSQSRMADTFLNINNLYKIEGATTQINDIYYMDVISFGPIENDKSEENAKERTAQLQIEIKPEKIIIINNNQESLFQNQYISENSILPQITLPNKDVTLKEIWEGSMFFPFLGKSLKTENQIIRTYGDILVIESKSMTSFDGTSIWSTEEMEERKYKNGTRFTFDYENNIGTADICGNGVYYFNIKSGYIENAIEFFSLIGTLKPKDKKTALEETKNNSVYLFLNINKTYKGQILEN